MKFLEGWAKPIWLANLMKGYHDDIDTKLNAIQNMFGTAGEADVTSEDILYKKKAYNGTTLITGSMPNNGAKEATLAAGGSYTIPKGYHNGNGKVTATDLASQTAGTASAAKILSGLTAWIAGKKVTGTMADKSGTTVEASAVTQDDTYTYLPIPAAGFYDTNSKVRTLNSNLDKRVFIIKDGVVQDGFTMNLAYAEFTYDADLGMSLVHATNKSYVPVIYFNVDLTNYSKVCKLTKNDTDRNGTWNFNLRSLLVSSSVQTLTDHGSYGNLSDGDISNIEDLSGNMYIHLFPYTRYDSYASTIYDYYVKDLWLE